MLRLPLTVAALTLPLQPSVFAILSGLIEDHAGLQYAPDDADLLAAKVSVRATELGFESLLDYYYFLRYDDAGGRELDALVATLTVHESYFFREYEQLRCLVDVVLAPSLRAGARLRLWSAACASGEEPYTVAMMLADRGFLSQVEIVASDVSEAALSRARAGELSLRAIRELPEPALAERWLERRERRVHVSPALREHVRFARVNLVRPDEVRALGTFDAILCRNVLIYFGHHTVQRVLALLEERLRPGGTLWVGVSESLLRWAPALKYEERCGVFFYRREG